MRGADVVLLCVAIVANSVSVLLVLRRVRALERRDLGRWVLFYALLRDAADDRTFGQNGGRS